MIRLLTLLILTFSFVNPVPAFAAMDMGIAATVNKDAISQGDVTDRMKLIFASSGISDTNEARQKVRPQALNILIEEQLKIQEAEKNNLTVTEEEIEEAFGAMASQNKMTPDEFLKVMAKSGIPPHTLRRQMKAQIAWSKVVGRLLRPRIDVTETDVSAKKERLKANVGKNEYQVSEIFLPVEGNKNDKKVKDLGLKLIEEIKRGRAPFAVIARQFSKAPSAQQGGSMGWVQEGDLAKELDLVVKSLSKGQVSPPIKNLSGYYILTLVDKRQVSEENLPADDDILNAIGLQRLDRLQKRYLSDIKSASFIDLRTN